MENDDAGLQYVEGKCGAKGRRLLTFFGFVGVLLLLIAHVTSGSDNRLPGDRQESGVEIDINLENIEIVGVSFFPPGNLIHSSLRLSKKKSDKYSSCAQTMQNGMKSGSATEGNALAALFAKLYYFSLLK